MISTTEMSNFTISCFSLFLRMKRDGICQFSTVHWITDESRPPADNTLVSSDRKQTFEMLLCPW
jgi:hypothetical protein